MIVKMLLWLTIYPIMIFAFFIMWLWEIASFLFNSPVDIWMLISDAVDGAVEEQ